MRRLLIIAALLAAGLFPAPAGASPSAQAYLDLAVQTWGLQSHAEIAWVSSVRIGEWPAERVLGPWPAGTELGGVTYLSGTIYLSESWWQARRHPRYRCDIVHHEVGHLALYGLGIPAALHHEQPGPMSEPVGRAFDACRRWYKTTRHYARSLERR